MFEKKSMNYKNESSCEKEVPKAAWEVCGEFDSVSLEEYVNMMITHNYD